MAVEGGTFASYQCPGINGGGNGGGAVAPFRGLSAVDIVTCLWKSVLPGGEEKRRGRRRYRGNCRPSPRRNPFDSICWNLDRQFNPSPKHTNLPFRPNYWYWSLLRYEKSWCITLPSWSTQEQMDHFCDFSHLLRAGDAALFDSGTNCTC